jgi:hypothetical protein
MGSVGWPRDYDKASLLAAQESRKQLYDKLERIEVSLAELRTQIHVFRERAEYLHSVSRSRSFALSQRTSDEAEYEGEGEAGSDERDE